MHNLLKKVKELLGKAKPIFKKLAKLLEPIANYVKKNDEIFRPIFVLTAICVIIAAALSLTNSLTAARIEQINLKNKNAEMAALLPAENYEEAVVMFETADPSFSIYEAKTGKEVLGYIITSSSKGYGGEIVIMTAFNPDKSIKGISILNADNETPGLGQNVTTDAFTSQFKGVSEKLTIVKTAPDNIAGEIKAVTGATISSKGAVNAVNLAKEYLEGYLTISENKQTQNENGGATIEE